MDAGAVMNQTTEESTKQQIDLTVKMLENYKNYFEYCKNKIKPSKSTTEVTRITDPALCQQFILAVGDTKKLKELIEQGTDVNTVLVFGKNETTPLCLAIAFNNQEAMDMLLDAGASFAVEITNEQGDKKLLEQACQDEIEQLSLGIIKARERLAYALSKAK